MKFKRLFPDVPEALAALTDEALAALLSGFREVSRKLRAAARGEVELDLALAIEAPEGTSPEDVSAEVERQWREAADVVSEIRGIQAAREQGAEQAVALADELDEAFGEDEEESEGTGEPGEAVEVAEGEEGTLEAASESDDDEDEEGDGDEEGDEEPSGEAAEEPVVAGAVPTATVFPNVGRRYAVPASGDVEPQELTLVAAGGNTGARIVAGEPLDRLGYADAVARVVRSRGKVTKVKGGARDRILIASAKHDIEDAIMLHEGDRAGNAIKLAQMGGYFRGPEAFQKMVAAMIAAGGICAPPEPIYTVPGFGTTARPVKSYLGTYGAPRGGVSIPGVTTIADYADPETDGGITVIEADEDAEGGTFSTKSCARVDCAEWTDVQVGIVSHCRVVGNLNSITWPEGVAHENDNTMVLLSRVAEGRLLRQMDALMLHTTGVATYGASATLLYNLTLARLGIISTLRLDRATRVQVLLPFWAADMFAMDLMHGALGGADGRFDTPASAVSGLLARYGIDAAWHLDEDPLGDDEIFAPQVEDEDLNDWPGTKVIARMSLPNTFIRLDTGELELGVVRDSDLNHQNDYELFGELFESVGRIGPEAATRRIELTVCPTGQIAAPDTSPFSCDAS